MARIDATGQAEGRAIHDAVGRSGDIRGGFDAEYYLLANTDVARAAVGSDTFAFAARHFEQYGWKEGRDPSTSFDSLTYLSTYTDVAAAKIDPMQHFLQDGLYEGRSTFADGTFGGGTLG
jgi:hypothetical protein